MPTYEVRLNRTVMENCTVEVEADNADEAGDKAIDDFIGEHNWENQETIDITVTDCSVVRK